MALGPETEKTNAMCLFGTERARSEGGRIAERSLAC